MRRVSASLLAVGWIASAALALVPLAGCSGGTEYKPFESSEDKRVWKLGGVDVTIEVADNEASRQQGLMHRMTMPENHGMLFVYPRPQKLSFWMKNTALPLSIAFLEEDADGKTATVVNIEDMQPYVEFPSTVSHRPVRFALEMNQGWFKKHGLKNGDKLELPPWIASIVATADGEGR